MVQKTNRDREYLNIILEPIRVCAEYMPKLGKGGRRGVSHSDFQQTYGADPFYSWFGLDNPLMYAAHKAAGGMTSLYRQIGLGSECLFRKIIQDELSLSEEEARWSYKIIGTNNKERKLSLDARIELDTIKVSSKKLLVRDWIRKVCANLDVDKSVAHNLKGAVFEVRQGYKSKDSKRQNADIANASAAYAKAYLPCVIVISNQIDSDVLNRYQFEKWAILTGDVACSSNINSTYAFMNEIIGYDIAGFFRRNSKILKREVEKVLEALLSAK